MNFAAIYPEYFIEYLSGNPSVWPLSHLANGKAHTADFPIHKPEHASLTPAKLLAMTAIDLPYDEAA